MENKELEFKYSRIGRMTRMGIEKVPIEKIIQEKKQKQNIAKLQRDVALVERQLHDSKERFTNLLKTCEKEHIKEANESKEVQAVLEDDLKAYQTFLNDQLDSCQEVSGKRKTLTK